MSIRIVILDGGMANPGDLSWDPISDLGRLTVYPSSSPEELVGRAKDADVIVTNKMEITGSHMKQLDSLKCICLLATGYNNIDINSARDLKIRVCNAVGYGTQSVAQHVFALILECSNAVGLHNSSIQNLEWAEKEWSYALKPMSELDGKTMGIYGFGRIGKKVAEIARSFGMNVLANHKHPERDRTEGVRFVSFDQLLKDSDIISLHAPLSQNNAGIICSETIDQMKHSAILINTGRGGLIHEMDLKKALLNKRIRAAALDVLATEPPPRDHPLIGLENCILTPHNAWATIEARRRLIDIVASNIRGHLTGEPINVVA